MGMCLFGIAAGVPRCDVLSRGGGVAVLAGLVIVVIACELDVVPASSRNTLWTR